ncbi:hypothetical protein ACQEWB_04795 [Streptomyces sp. CA-249302]|uniref:hypothetical protein n=1 Tax=Streptomyces sp. CA-249302 TaxID=3240058 RepID=UPI003D94B111
MPTGVAVTGAIIAAAVRDHAVAFMTASAVIALLAVLMVAAVPAIWSRKPERRNAALVVLRMLLGRRWSSRRPVG